MADSFFLGLKVIVLAVCLLLSGTGDGHTAGPAASGKPIVIGALFNQSGGFAAIDSPSLNGLVLGVTEINKAGGVLGRPLKIVAEDTESRPQDTANITTKLIHKAEPVVLVGFNDSDFALAAGRVAQQAGIPFVSPGATLPDLPRLVGPNFFMAAFGDDAQAEAVAIFALKRLQVRNVWILSDQSYEFTKTLDAYFTNYAEKLGLVIGSRADYNSGCTDFSPQIAAMKKALPKPDAIFVSAVPPDAGPVVLALRKAGFSQPILSGDGFDTPLLLQVAKEHATNVFYSTHAALDNPSVRMSAFDNLYRKYFWIAPENAFAVMGFDTAYLVADAIQRAGSAEPKAIREALARTRGFQGLSGDLTYRNGSGKPHKAVTIIRVQDGKSGFSVEISPN